MSKRPGDEGYAPGWCIHYRYNRNAKKPEEDTCEAGVRYDQFRGEGKTYKTQPCFLTEDGKSKPGAEPCACLRLPTAEEIRLHEEWFERVTNRMGIVMTGIKPWRDKHKGRSTSEVVECPACKGRLHLSISSYNGHVHGHCETQNCVSWME